MTVFILSVSPSPPSTPTVDAVIEYSDGILRPDVVTDYESVRAVQTITHPILGATFPDITERPAQSRAGKLRCTFGDESASAEAEAVFAAGGAFTLRHPLRETVEMVFVVTSEIRRTWNTAGYWIVEVGFVEVLS